MKKIVLPNGMKFLILERHQTPVFSAHIRFNVGSVDEQAGRTGISHFLEHLMFKGTKQIGSWDCDQERDILDNIEKVLDAVEAERASINHDSHHEDKIREKEKLEELKSEFEKLQKKAGEFVVENEIWKIYQKNGAVGLNASTGQDSTQYYVSLPANKLELWFFLESDRIANPFFREFYSERDVILEERRLRYENQPQGKLREAFFATAYVAHPYKWPVIGWSSDIAQLRENVVMDYYKKYYSPNNATAVIVGDVKTEEVIQLAEKFFGPLPAQKLPKSNKTLEPAQAGERRVNVEFKANPAVLIGYHVPEFGQDDLYALDVLNSVLSDGRTGRFYKHLVQEKRVAFVASSSIFFGRYPGLFIINAVPKGPTKTEELEEAIYQEIEKLMVEPPSDWELGKIRNNLQMEFFKGLESNAALARQLAVYESLTGRWNYLAQVIEKERQVTKEDVMRVARKYLTKSNRTVATLVNSTLLADAAK
ncbi:MAG: insulinase family protein [Candidatus Tectomicrobia bacterium]|uniref:Insulinase family protein n=1 Tax=Tectimicrobiota bacterium TaxID=2528274 RepID=A0A933GLV7_UNCTE|nr:insulinase family protein [Candidatus Tectomicrobia bacterium]